MAHINEKDAGKLRELFSGLQNQVQILFFTQEHECQFCKTTREILEEVSALAEKLSLEVRDFVDDSELAASHGVDKIPATVLIGEKDHGVRFFGIPAGYEFTTLIEDIVDLARRDPRLPEPLQAELAKIDRPVHLQVLVSPTCPYCPAAVRAAHRLAMVSDQVVADMIETAEFPHLAVKYGVSGVPHTVINENHSVTGPQPEAELVRRILAAIGK